MEQSLLDLTVIYRCLQIAVIYFNNCMQTVLVGFFVAAGTVQIFSVYTVINQFSKMDHQTTGSLMVFFCYASFESVIIILVVYGFAGTFNHESISSLKAYSKLLRLNVRTQKERKHLVLFHKSCKPLCIQFGASNYIEKTTPLVFQMFCVCRISDMLLLNV